MRALRKHAAAGWAVAIGAAALAVYAATLSRGPFPGESALLMATQLGLAPLGPTDHWMWQAVSRALLALSPLGDAATLNLSAALYGAFSIGLFFSVLRASIVRFVAPDEDNRQAAETASLIGAATGSAALGLAMPFWFVANRFHPGAFDVFLLLVVARLFLSLLDQGGLRRACVLMAVSGVVATEFATLLLFLPLLALGTLLLLWLREDWRWWWLLALGLSLTAGLGCFLAAALFVQRSPAFALMGENELHRAVYAALRHHYVLIARGLPRVGWLLVVAVGILPWFAVLGSARKALNEEKDWGVCLLHVILTLGLAAVLFNAPFAPWPLMGTYRLLVTPYVLIAFSFGYLAAYWFLFPRRWWTEADEPARTKRQQRTGRVLAGLLLATAIAAGIRNAPTVNARLAGVVNDFAAATVRQLGDIDWLVTDGAIDENLLVAAREAGKPIHLINLRRSANALYRRSVGATLSDPRLRGLAEVDLFALLRAWTETDPRISEQLAFMVLPDLWIVSGYEPVPSPSFFRGKPAGTAVDVKALHADHERFWGHPFLGAAHDLRTHPLLESQIGLMLQTVSMAANNLGVLLEDAGEKDLAYAAYAKARELNPSNLSAFLNQAGMGEAGYASPDAETIKRQMEAFDLTSLQPQSLWELSRVCGYVRRSEAFAGLGFAWALSGQPGMAVAGFRRALELAPDRESELSRFIASAYMAKGQTGETEDILLKLLEKNPSDRRALLGLARVYVSRGRLQEASGLLDRALAAGVDPERVSLERAAVFAAASDIPRARIILQEAVDRRPEDPQALSLLASLMIEQRDFSQLDRIERQLRGLNAPDFIVAFVLGQMALVRSDMSQARIDLDHAITMKPGDIGTLELLLRIDIQEAREDKASEHIATILSFDPNHAFANQVLASLQIKRGHYALAEASLRSSLERSRSPDVLNDLAWVLQARSGFEEAEQLAREALRANASSYSYWDTLGVILMRRQRYPEAEEALTRATELYADDPAPHAHLAELYERMGDRPRAAKLAESLLPRESELQPSERDLIRRLARLSTP